MAKDKGKAKVGIIGSGVMGRALVHGLVESGAVSKDTLWVYDRNPEATEALAKEFKVEAVDNPSQVLKKTEILLICVKPANVKTAVQQVREWGLPSDTLIISIAAGVSLDQLQTFLGTKNPVIRAMPNTPSIVREGMTVICGGKYTQAKHLQSARKIFEAVGKCLELDEHHFDAVTGLSGSGPAYIYLIIEALADGGVKVGLPRKEALDIITQTMLGAAQMVQKTGQHPAELRDDVTTPAGCTIGALLVLEDGKIRSVLARAVEEAAGIAGKLGK